MKRLFTILFLLPLFASAQFTFTPLTDEIIAPGRGAEQWHNSTERIPNPTESDVVENSKDVYYRFEWARMEGATLGSYTWTYFDNLINTAIDNGQKFSFGIMTHFSDGGLVSYGGGTSSYPLYLHTLMQAETYPDWKNTSTNVWVPNWNSVNYLARLRALHESLYAHIIASSHSGVQYKDAIYTIDIRGYGNWGEWHSGQIVSDLNQYPTGTRPTATTLKTIIDHHSQVFDLWPLSIMIAALDGGSTGIPIFGASDTVTHYALTQSNTWGLFGWRRDSWGATNAYFDKLLKNNLKTFAGSLPFKDYILERHKYAPITGEPMPTDLTMTDLVNQVNDYGVTSIGNGNYGGYPPLLSTRNNIRAAFKRSGYRYELTGGQAIPGSSTFRILLDWRNVGVAPTYESWIVEYKLKNGGGTVVWTDTSSFTPTLFTDEQGNVTAEDIFTKPVLADGNYTLYATIKDPSGFRDPLPLAITGRDVDGSYLLGTVTFPGVGPRPDPEEPPPAPEPGEPTRIKWNRKFRAN